MLLWFHLGMADSDNDNFLGSYLISNPVAMEFVRPEATVIIFPVFVKRISFFTFSAFCKESFRIYS